MNSLSKWQELAADVLSPPFCLCCGRPGHFLCGRCHHHLEILPAIDFSSQLRANYQERGERYYPRHTLALLDYDNLSAKLICRFKYQGESRLAQPLAYWLYQSLFFPAVDALTFVPLSAPRQAQRGYNQAELLAQNLATHLHLPVLDTLARPHTTCAQAEKTRQQRLRLMEQKWLVKQAVAGRRLLVIDDVITTGATLNQAAKTLLLAGALSVDVLALAIDSETA